METTKELPRLFVHSQNMYDLMKSNAHEADTGELIYDGFIVAFAKEHLGIAGPTYANVMRCLQRMGCIEQIQRGSKHATSKWSILDPPDLDTFQTLDHKSNPTATTLDSRLNKIEQDLSSLRLSIGDMNVQEAYIGLAKSIQELNARVNRLQSGGD